MAKRRKLEAPSADDLNQMEEAFRRETPAGKGAAPIAQVASESAMNMEVMTPDTRRKMAELERLKQAEGRGLLAQEILLDQIDETALTRDRVALDPDEFKELKASIVLNGLRMPIEVFEVENPSDGEKRYGLVSGYRRLLAVRELRGAPGQLPGVIEAFVRKPKSGVAHMEAMIEENEVRSALTHYERGRISVLAAQNGFYDDVEAAVNRLFRFASKAKRSKIRSFSVVHEELGDLLKFPQSLTEKQGIRLAAALRDGQGSVIREALSDANAATSEDEWSALETAMKGFAAKPSKPSSRSSEPDGLPKALQTSNGIKVAWGSKGDGVAIHIDAKVPDEVIYEIGKLLER